MARLKQLPTDSIYHVHNLHLHAGRLSQIQRNVINTVHNQARMVDTFGGGSGFVEKLKRAYVAHVFKKVPTIVAVSDHIRQQMTEQLGIPAERVRVVNAYIPPEPDELADPKEYERVKIFRERFEFLGTACTTANQMWEGIDRYGIDMCIDMLVDMKASKIDLGIVVAAPNAQGTSYAKTLHAYAEDKGVADRILWLFSPGFYHPIMQECSLYLRPTNADGFAIAVAEACEFGVPVVASNVCARPQGCALFETRSDEAFSQCVKKVLYDLTHWQEQSRTGKEPDRYPDLLSVYESVCGK